MEMGILACAFVLVTAGIVVVIALLAKDNGDNSQSGNFIKKL